MVFERSEFQLTADALDHLRVLRRVGVGVGGEVRAAVAAFQRGDHAARDEIHIRGRTREIEVFTAEQQRRAGGTDVDLLCAAVVEELSRLAELRAAHDRIVDQNQPLAADERVDRNQLHPRNEVALGLVLRHKRARPRRCVLDKRTREGDASPIGVADCVRGARIRHAGHTVRFYVVTAGEHVAAVVAHLFHIYFFIGGGRVAEVHPKEGADFHFVCRRDDDLDRFGGDEHHLARPQLAAVVVSQIEVGERFKRRAVGALLLADDDRRAPEPVTCGVDAFRREDEHRHRPVDYALRVADALRDRVAPVDERGRQLGGIDVAAAHLQKVRRSVGERLLDERVDVVDAPDRADGEVPEVRTHDERLRLGVGNAADAQVPFHFFDVALEFGTERRVLDVVDRALKPVLAVDGHPAALGAEVGMVVGTEKQIKYTVALGGDPEKSAHMCCTPLSLSVVVDFRYAGHRQDVAGDRKMDVFSCIGDAVDPRRVVVVARPRILREKLQRAVPLVGCKAVQQCGREVYRQPLFLHLLAKAAACVRPRIGVRQVGLDVQHRRAVLHIDARDAQHRPIARVCIDCFQLQAGQRDRVRPVRRSCGEHAEPPVSAQARRPYRRRPAFPQGFGKQPEHPDVREVLQSAERLGHPVFRLENDPARQRRVGRALARHAELGGEVGMDAPNRAEGDGVAHIVAAFLKARSFPGLSEDREERLNLVFRRVHMGQIAFRAGEKIGPCDVVQGRAAADIHKIDDMRFAPLVKDDVSGVQIAVQQPVAVRQRLNLPAQAVAVHKQQDVPVIHPARAIGAQDTRVQTGKQPQRVVRGNRRFVRALPQRPARELFVQDACPAVPFDQPECLGRGKSDLAEAYGVSVFVLDVCARIAGREQLADRPVSEVVNDGGSALSESVHR